MTRENGDKMGLFDKIKKALNKEIKIVPEKSKVYDKGLLKTREGFSNKISILNNK